MRPAVAVSFGTGDGFRFLVPGKCGVEGGGDCSGKIGLAEGRQAGRGGSVIMLASAPAAAISDGLVRNGES